MRWRISRLFGPLHRDVGELVGGRLDPDVHPAPLRLLAQPQPREVVAADPPEIIVPEPEDGAVVDHPPVLVAHRGIDHLPHREPAHVAGHAELHQRLGVGAEDLVLAQRREVRHHRPLPAGPVLADRPVGGEVLREPVPVVLDEVARMRGEAVVEPGVLRHPDVGVGGHAEPPGWLEVLVPVVHPHLDVGGVPSVRGVDVARTGGGEADEVGEGAHEHEIARTRPGLVHPDGVGVIEHGVEEEVDGRPAAARADAEALALGVDVVRAVHVAGVSQVLVVTRRAREAEGIVAPAGILDELEQRLVIDGVVLGVQAGAGVERAHQGAGGGGVDLALQAPVEGAQAERLEVGALAPLHVHDLNELARLDFVAQDGAGLDVEVDHRVRERRRRAVGRLPVRPRLAADVEHDLGRGALLVHRHRAAGGAGHEGGRGGGDERGRRSRARFAAEQPHRGGPAEVEAAGREGVADALGGGDRAIEDGPDAERRPGPFRADERGVRPPAGVEDHQLAGLPALPIHDRQLVPGVEGQGAGAPARNRMPLDVGRQHGKPRHQHRPAPGRHGRDARGDDHVTVLSRFMRSPGCVQSSANGLFQSVIPAKAGIHFD